MPCTPDEARAVCASVQELSYDYDYEQDPSMLLPCYYDDRCLPFSDGYDGGLTRSDDPFNGLGCNAGGHAGCRFCGGSIFRVLDCPSPSLHDGRTRASHARPQRHLSEVNSTNAVSLVARSPMDRGLTGIPYGDRLQRDKNVPYNHARQLQGIPQEHPDSQDGFIIQMEGGHPASMLGGGKRWSNVTLYSPRLPRISSSLVPGC